MRHARDNHEIQFVAALRGVWKWRNNMVFESLSWSIHEAWRRICHDHDELTTFLDPQSWERGVDFILGRWIPSMNGKVKINSDGSFQAFKNCMSGGGVTRDEGRN